MSVIKELLDNHAELQSVAEDLRQVDKRQEELEKNNRELRRRVASLEKGNDELKKKIANLTESGSFREAGGVLWRMRPDGTYERFPYCPHCEVPMSSIGSMLVCRQCNWEAPIGTNDVDHVRKSLD